MFDSFLWLKNIHVFCVVVSFAGFFIRGIAMLNEALWLKNRWARISPHVIDATLLVTAILMVVHLQLSVINIDWLLTKIVALVIYIYLGFVALKLGKTKKSRTIAWSAGLFVFLFIVSVAISKSPYGIISYW